ncbi:MAG TPA: VOC family protein [Usitatibacter sp.]|nr:VOC family protein [Usitatibacter sp.]
MAIESINHYNLRAAMPVLESMRDWYLRTVGLEVGKRPPFSHRGFWLYGGGRPLLHLSEESRGESHPVPGSGTFDHVAFTCTDYDAMRARLDALGEAYQTADVPATRTRQIFLRDPGGNGVELNFEMT